MDFGEAKPWNSSLRMFKMQREHRSRRRMLLRSSLEGLGRNDDVAFQTEYKNALKIPHGWVIYPPLHLVLCTLYCVLILNIIFHPRSSRIISTRPGPNSLVSLVEPVSNCFSVLKWRPLIPAQEAQEGPPELLRGSCFTIVQSFLLSVILISRCLT